MRVKLIKINKIFGDVLEIEPFIHKDERGFFYEKFNLKRYKDMGLDGPWVQDNLSKSKKKLTAKRDDSKQKT